MRSYQRIESPVSQLSIFLLLVGAGFFVTLLASSAILIGKGIIGPNLKSLDLNDVKTIAALKWVQGVSSITMFLLPAMAFALVTFRFRPFYFLGFRKQPKINFYLLAVIMLVCSFPFVGWLGEMNEHIPLAQWMVDSEKEASKQMNAFLKMNNSSDVIFNILLIALLPAICEEVFFRGCLQRIMIYLCKSPWAGIIITAALFSAFHMQFQGFFPRMFLGILLGAIYWYSNSLWPNIIAHFFNNAIQVIAVIYYPKMIDENPNIPILAALISAVITILLMRLLVRQSNNSYPKEYEMEEVNEHNQFIA